MRYVANVFFFRHDASSSSEAIFVAFRYSSGYSSFTRNNCSILQDLFHAVSPCVRRRVFD